MKLKMKTGKRKDDKQTNKQTNESNRSTVHTSRHIHFESSLSLSCLKWNTNRFWNRIQNEPGNSKQRKINIKVTLSCMKQ